MYFSNFVAGPRGNRARKRELNIKKDLPTISEVQARFGESLSSIFFDFLAVEEKEVIGLIPTLQGPERSKLWVSPNDNINNDIKLTTFEDIRCQKALTHQNILKIGEKIEYDQNLENERKINEATDCAIRETIKFLTKRKEDKESAKQSVAIFSDRSTSYDIDDNWEVDESKQFDPETFDGKLSLVGVPGEDNKDNEKSDKELNQSILTSLSSNNSNQVESKDSKRELETEMQQALVEREQFLMKKMKFHILWESEKQYEIYKSKITEAHKKWICLYKNAKLSFEKELKKMEFEMEARHLADVMKIHERKMMELRTLKEIMERHFFGVVDTQRIEIEKREKIIKDLIALIETREDALRNWESKVRDIMKDFQNLLKFMKMETPNQTELLVDFEQILDETLQVPKTSPITAYVSSIENEYTDGLQLEGIDQFLKECDASIGKVYSTTVEVVRQDNEFDIAFHKIFTELRFENMKFDENVSYEKNLPELQQYSAEPGNDDSRLGTILKTLKRNPSLQRIIISTNITNN